MHLSHSPNLNFPYIQAAQSQKHVTVNHTLQILDALSHLSVHSRNITTAPIAPANGDRYLIPVDATEEWALQTSHIAIWQDNSWVYFQPVTGWRIWVEDENLMLVWSDSAWQPVPVSATEIQNLMQIGINTQADINSRLFVESPTVTFNAESQDIRCVLNKDAETDTASIIMQSGTSGRAELGLTGSNDLCIKTSSDGTNWDKAITVANVSQECEFHAPVALPQISKSSLPDASSPARLIYVLDATGGPTVAWCDGSDWKRLNDNTIIN